jgi:L-alanine-DL-glutamate epimerase-like enolase superfamily enzyme
VSVQHVEPIPVAYPEPNDNGTIRHLCLVKLTTDDGLTGWGEAVTVTSDATVAVARLIEGVAGSVLGANPLHTEAVWHQMKDRAWWYGHGGGMASFAISAIDTALWDLKGKLLGCSVLDLLGGPVHERLPTIACSHAFSEQISQMCAEAEAWLAAGFRGVKIGFGKPGRSKLGFLHDRDVEYVAAMRAMMGPDKSLMIDVGPAAQWDVATAVRRVRAFDEYQVDWVEEPLGAWDPDGYAVLRDKTAARIAYGEREWTLAGYDRILRTGTCDVLGVDPGRAEGVTGFKKVADQVTAYGRQANAHAWSSAIVTAASLAISFCSPSVRVFELKPLHNPMQHELVERPFEQTGGWIAPPSGPGLGIDVREDVVARYRY